MKNIRYQSQSVRIVALVVLAVMGSQLPTLANIKPKSASNSTNIEQQVAQNQRSLCRRVIEQQGLAVHSRPTPTSPVVGGVGFNTEVTLAENNRGTRGPDGRTWVEITAPQKGYISNGFPDSKGNLEDCSDRVETPPPNNNRNLCRQIDLRAAPRGVVVRAKPSRFSERVGGVPTGARVRLVQNFKLVPDTNGEKRDWVEITEPEAGFISANTLIMCQ